MRFKSIVVTATAPLCKTENMAVGEVSASPPRTKEKAAANRTSHVRQATAFGGKNRLRGSRRLSHETENLVLLGRSGLLVRLLRGVMLLVSLSLLRMMLGNSRVRCSSRSSVSSACRQDRSGQAQNSGHTKSRNKRLLHFPVPQLGFPFGVFPAGGKALSCPPVSAMSGLIPRSLRASA